MNRTFQHKVSKQAVAAIILLAATALWCFLARTSLSPLVGLVCMMAGAAAIDRLVNTTYTFATDGTLTIRRGRLARPQHIEVAAIMATHKMRGSLFTAPHIVIEYGTGGRMIFAQPSDFDAFVDEIRHRQECQDSEYEKQ